MHSVETSTNNDEYETHCSVQWKSILDGSTARRWSDKNDHQHLNLGQQCVSSERVQAGLQLTHKYFARRSVKSMGKLHSRLK